MEVLKMIMAVAATICIVCFAIIAVWITGWFIRDAIDTWLENRRRK